ncbi:cbb3-type cytochrome c oxidase N-terminal domain-containing protein [Salinimicrobium xinjiangense]|uniref:cbb3-type cytochrome c oxidase N-terminal domain-containing protein n=1 Tax=Salinimicrobium xinjiangense TaxID=438596 RepID=UPI0004147807|nr:cbb3-type cytochrome c oxidase N-terminal domain-containing protein [Salinimicrobium xinjiangense]
MRHAIPAWIRIPIIFLIIAGALEYFIDSGENFAFIEYPMLSAVLVVILLFLIAAELILDALENVLFQSLSPEAKERYMAAHQERMKKYDLKRIYRKLAGTRPISEEGELELDHNYDGIRELDNKLPPWWLYSFYASIIFAVGYMAYYHMLGGENQTAEFEQEMLAAKIAVEEYKKSAPDLVDAESVVMLTEASDLETGKALYNTNCMACHAADGGGGIGPNLVDEHWILGGSIQDVFHTISEGGRAGKGMVAWKSILKPTEIQQVSSYILSLQGSTPANPKAPEGDVWEAE